MSIMDGDSTGAVQFYSGNDGFKIARKFSWHPGEWQTVRIRVKMSQDANGGLIASVNGDAFSGVKDLPIYRPDATDYRPKWGFYRGRTVTGMHDDWVEHKDQIAHKLSGPATRPK